eukprot:3270836-Rhodomonas_salina.2
MPSDTWPFNLLRIPSEQGVSLGDGSVYHFVDNLWSDTERTTTQYYNCMSLFKVEASGRIVMKDRNNFMCRPGTRWDEREVAYLLSRPVSENILMRVVLLVAGGVGFTMWRRGQQRVVLVDPAANVQPQLCGQI